MGQPRPLFVYFRSFQTNITNFYNKCPSSIRCRESNPRPLERESFPITTRPGLPPYSTFFVHFSKASKNKNFNKNSSAPRLGSYEGRSSVENSQLCLSLIHHIRIGQEAVAFKFAKIHFVVSFNLTANCVIRRCVLTLSTTFAQKLNQLTTS